MATKIVTKNSSTASAVPTASDLVQGELAVNVADKRLFTEDNAGAIVELGTNPSTLTVTGEITANGGIALGDNDKATFGDGSDLQIYHDGANSYIQNATNSLIIQNDSDDKQVIIKSDNGSGGVADYFRANGTTGEALLYHYGSAKLATTSTGIDVTGTATMDGLVSAGTAFVNLTSRPAGVPATAGALWSAQTETGNYGIVSRASSTDSFTYIGNTGSAATLGTSYGSSGSYLPLDLQTSDKKRLSIASNGDISFYEDTGTTPKLFWDASAESLGIGTSSFVDANARLVVSNGTINLEHYLYTAGSIGYIGTRTNHDLGFTSNGQERMRIDSSGNVGIGVAPAFPFHVQASDGALAQFSNGVDADCTIRTASGVTLITPSTGTLALGTSSTERLRIDSSGKLTYGGISYGVAVDPDGSGGFGAGYNFETNSGSPRHLVTGPVTGQYLSSGSSPHIAWFTGASAGAGTAAPERMRIDSSGNVGVGTSSPQELIHAYSGSTSAAIRASGVGNNNSKVEIGYHETQGPYIKAGSSGINKLQVLVDNTSLAAEFRSNGDFYSNDGTVHSLSDSRVKKDIADLTDGLDLVKQLRPRTFKFNGKATTLDDDRTRYGFVADEVMAVASQYVSLGTQTIDDVEVDDFKSLSTTKMIPMLVKAIQEQQTLIESLTARIAALEE